MRKETLQRGTMAGKKKKVVTTEIVDEPETPTLPGDGLETELPPEDVEESEALRSIIEQFGNGTVKIKVLKDSPKGPLYCFTSTDATLDEDFIQTHYGGGTYSLRVFINEQLRKTIKLNIADRLMPIGSAPSPEPQRNSGGDSEFLKEMILALLQNRQQTPVGELAQAMRDLGVAGNQNQGSSEKMVEMLIKGMEIGRESGGGGGSDWKSVLADVLKPAVPGLMAHFAGAPQPGQNPPQDQKALAMQSQENDRTAIISGIQYLKKKAISGINPDLVVEWIVSNAEEYQPLIRVVLNTEFATIASFDPEIGTEPFFSWFKPLYDGLRSAFEQPNPVVDDPGEPSGDAIDIAVDGGTSKKGKPK